MPVIVGVAASSTVNPPVVPIVPLETVPAPLGRNVVWRLNVAPFEFSVPPPFDADPTTILALRIDPFAIRVAPCSTRNSTLKSFTVVRVAPEPMLSVVLVPDAVTFPKSRYDTFVSDQVALWLRVPPCTP